MLSVEEEFNRSGRGSSFWDVTLMICSLGAASALRSALVSRSLWKGPW